MERMIVVLGSALTVVAASLAMVAPLIGLTLAAAPLLLFHPVRRSAVVWAPLLMVAVNDARLELLIEVEVTMLQKLAVIAVWGLAAVVYGIRLTKPAVAMLAAWTLALVVAVAFCTPLLTLSTADMLRSWDGYLFPFLAFLLTWDRIGARSVAEAVVALPWLSIGLGAVLQALGQGPLLRAEYTGVPRLQGAVIPAHMGMLGFVATVAACWLLLQQARGATLLAVASVGVCLASGTRGASVAALVVLTVTLLRGRVGAGRKVFATAAGAGALAVFVPLLLQRSQTTGDGLVNASGRFAAWDFWGLQAREAPWFGRGPGASFELTQNINPTGVLDDFTVPHNTYLQLWLDFGWVGCAILLVGFVVFWRGLRWMAPQEARPVLTGMLAGLAFYALVDNVLVTAQLTVPLAMVLAAMASASRGGAVGDETEAEGACKQRHKRRFAPT